MQDTLIRDVSDTAFMVATLRAMEGERKDALFRDPLAGELAGEHGRRIVAALPGGALRMQQLAWMMAVRTVIIDDFILRSVAEGTDAVLCLGAGLDTRPYRMTLPESLTWIEVDFPHIIELKERRLAEEKPRCRLERVRLDLSDLPARRILMQDVGGRFKRVLVLTEGVVLYLAVEAAGGLADDLASQRTFVQWIVDYTSSTTVRYSQRPGAAMRNAPFLFDPKDFFGFFREHGWACREARYLWDEGEKLKRPLPMPDIVRSLFRFGSLFMSSARRVELRRFMGYVLLDRASATS
jgi:methyltransferase (TIGR00027 family)